MWNEEKLGLLRVEREAEAERMGLSPDAVSTVIRAHDDFDGGGMSKDKFKGDFAALLPKSRNESGGLLSELSLVLGARLMLKKNIKVTFLNCRPFLLSMPAHRSRMGFATGRWVRWWAGMPRRSMDCQLASTFPLMRSNP